MVTNRKDFKDTRRSKHITWKNTVDYWFNFLGWIVGLGNVWRFPYLCFKNGGGAFLVVYFIFLILVIFPLVVMEAALGQFVGRSTVKCWRIVPIMAGIGYFGFGPQIYFGMTGPVIMSWIMRWIVASLSKVLPWTTCGNTWNADGCIDVYGRIDEMNASADAYMSNSTSVSSVEEYWHKMVLGSTSGLMDPGNMQWGLLACLTVCHFILYFCLWKGIGWTSKIVYVTATLPVLLLIVMVVKALTLEGGSAGLSFYLAPNTTRLLEIDVWHDAASQVMYSIGTGSGAIVTLSGYNKFHHNFFRDLVIIVIVNACVSLLAGLAVFPVLGYLAHCSNTTVADVVQSGPGLVFTVYPAALALLPLPNLWCAIFFTMLFFTAIDTLFVSLETMLACFQDLFPKIFKWSRKVVVGGTLFFFYLCGIPMMMGNGIYILEIFDRYAVTGWSVLFVTIMEFITIGWIYGPDRLCQNIKAMLGYRLPPMWIEMTSRFIGPCLTTIVLVVSVIGYKPLVEHEGYPPWADALGWMLALSSISWIPGIAIYAVWTAEGDTLIEKFRSSLTPIILKRGDGDGEEEEMSEIESKGNYQ